MSRKRSSTESSCSEQANENSDCPIVQDEVTTKRVKLDLISEPSHTTLQDLPLELLQYILVQVVAMEAKDSKMAKCVWKEKTGPSINRLRSVCSLWNDVLETDFFQNELNRTLDGMVEKTNRLEVVLQSTIHQLPFKLTTLKDNIYVFLINTQINVYNRKDMAEVKRVIHISEYFLIDIEACYVNNCVYALGNFGGGLSVVRIDEDERIYPWINNLTQRFSTLSVSADGDLMIVSGAYDDVDPANVSVYNASGSLQHQIQLSSEIYSFRFGRNVLKKSNGNIVLTSLNDQRKTQITEIDTSGSIVRQYQSAIGPQSAVNFADIYGRILISNSPNNFQLLDSELNPVNLTVEQFKWDQTQGLHLLHYDSDRNEVVGIYPQNPDDTVLAIFRLVEVN